MAARRATLLALSALAGLSGICSAREPPGRVRPFERPEYPAIKKNLIRGWGTWDTGNALAQVFLPDSLSIGLSFRHPGGSDSYERPQMVRDRRGDEFSAGTHAIDGSYSEADIGWKGIPVRVQSATEGDDLVILVTLLRGSELPVEADVDAQMLWNRPGRLFREPGRLTAVLPDRVIRVYGTGREIEDAAGPNGSTRLRLVLGGEVGISTGKPRTIGEIQTIVLRRRGALEREAASHGDLADAFDAIRAGIGWSTIYEPGFDRMVTVVSRDWDMGSKGYIMFGWDQFFLSYACSLFGRDLAYANLMEHMRSLTPDGFIPNVEVTGGKTSLDRSQPPVGSLMAREIFKRYGDRWILEATFDDLLAWNRWWPRARMNGGLLAWGSGLAANPMREKEAHTAVAAAWESGMDDSPMYDGVPFNPVKGMFELQDVGLNGLYIADCRALADIADTIGRVAEARELRSRADEWSARIESLWDPSAGLYLNRRADTGKLSHRISPTMFYPLIGRVPSPSRASEMVESHLLNPAEFGGRYGLPSIARNDPSFPQQHYWKGAVWPPLNFLVYLGLRNYDLPQARRELAAKSMAIFLGEWKRKGFVSENYSALNGTGDDPRLTSTPFYSWGVLMGLMGFIEAGQMPAPETSIGAR